MQFLDRVSGPYWDQVRDLIEDWFSRLCPDAQADVRAACGPRMTGSPRGRSSSRTSDGFPIWRRTVVEDGNRTFIEPVCSQAEWFGLGESWPVGEPFPR